MSVSQYIGARYVTKFADPIEWSSTKSYEALTVVQFEGDSYVSKQAVPIGVDISNTKYWLHWADYNAQIEQYRQELINTVEQIESLINTPANGKYELLYSGVIPSISYSPFTIFKIPINTHMYQISKRDITNFINWRSYLENYKTPILFVNGPLDGIEISDSVIQLSNTSGNYWTIFGIKNGSPICINQPPNQSRFTATELLNQGWTFAAGGFAKFIENGITVDLSIYSDCYKYADSINAIGQRTAIGWDSDYWYIFACPGRRPYANGFDYTALVNVFKYFNIPNGVNMDGGGSVQCYTNNPLFEVTQVSETNIRVNQPPLTTRNVPFMIGFGD